MSDAVLLTPCKGTIHPAVASLAEGLRDRYGWPWLRADGFLVDYARSYLASRAMQTNAEWFAWCDADTVTDPQTVWTLVESAKAHPCTILAAPVPGRGSGGFPAGMGAVIPVYGAGGGIYEAHGFGFGLTVTHRSVFDAIAEQSPPAIYGERGSLIHPTVEGRAYFMPFVDDLHHFSEDASFCRRAQRAGHPIMCDSRVTSVMHQCTQYRSPGLRRLALLSRAVQTRPELMPEA